MTDDSGDDPQQILALVQRLVGELEPDPGLRPGVTWRSELDRDLGLDSLGRAELLGRVERALDLPLSEQLLVRVETVADVVSEVRAARAQRAPSAGAQARVRPSIPAAPPTSAAIGVDRLPAEELAEQTAIVDVLRWHARVHPDRPHVHLIGEAADPETLTYGDLLDAATTLASGLLSRGVEPGARVAIMLPTGADYLASFFAPMLIGAVPVPIYPPVRPSQIEAHLRRQAGILRNAGARVLISVREALPLARLLRSGLPELRHVIAPEQLGQSGDVPAYRPGSEDIAFLQYTSGSTGDPKGVVLNHRNLLSNINAMGEAVAVSSSDVMVSWLPLYHDMGLIGGWLTPLHFGFPTVLMTPLSFLAHPERWLSAIHRYRGTLSAAPNFGYELCARKVRQEDLPGLDLSSWRFALNGSEPVSPATLQRFCDRFAACGFRRESMAPAYGLAECSVGLSFPPLGRGPVVDRVKREPFTRGGRAQLASPDDDPAQVLRFVGCGRPLRGHEVRVVDARDRELGERREGMLEFRGPSATCGYFGSPERTRQLFDGPWLRTGDRGYVAQGELYVSGRVKDMIIRGGRNIHPQELEHAVGELEGVRTGCVAVFASTDPVSRTERLVVLAETRTSDLQARAAVRAEINALTVDLLATPPDDVVLVSPHVVLKTSSGKIRRAACRHSYENGTLAPRERAVWWQLVRLGLSTAVPRLRRLIRSAVASAYAAYAWLVFAVVSVPGWALLLLLPARWSWSVARMVARSIRFALGIRVSVEGVQHLPDTACVLVSNHQSDLDGFVLVAALPRRFSIVVKSELRRRFWTRWPLDRLGAEYVERQHAPQGVATRHHVVARATAGATLLFFPEGTHTRMPGILPFHSGAFLTAAQARLPLVPILIHGTRNVLRPDARFVRRAAIRVTVGAPFHATGADWKAAVELGREVRGWMLERSGEPDLGWARDRVP